MTSRKWIGPVLITLVVVAILAAGGFALYRFGYSRGALAASTGEGVMFHNFDRMPFPWGRMGDFPKDRLGELPQRFEGGFDFPDHRFDSRSVPFDRSLPTRSFASPFSIVLRVLFFGLFIWVLFKVSKLFTGGKNWQLSFNSQVAVEPEEEVKKKGSGKAK